MRKKQATYGFGILIGAMMLAGVAFRFSQGRWSHDEILMSSPAHWPLTSLLTLPSTPSRDTAIPTRTQRGVREDHQQSFSSTSSVRVADFQDARVRANFSKDRYVHATHLDGFNAEAFRKMLEAGQLPHFKFLVEHGRLSTRATTVDNSETMKVIPSVLSSKVDTRIAG